MHLSCPKRRSRSSAAWARLRRASAALATVLGGWIVGCSSQPPPEVVDHVDLTRYRGLWYEIARYPVWFERNCYAVTAHYRLRVDGKIDVTNACRKGSLDGPRDVAEGVARVVDPKTNAKLKVCFFWPFAGDYWIIDLDEAYQWAVVSAPNRKVLWILSRAPQMDPALYERILVDLSRRGFDTERLFKTPQPGGG